VDQLLDFWNPGVFFERTALYERGRLVRCALVPLICDLPAARQVSGHGSAAATYFCSFCKLKIDDIENLSPDSWPLRNAGEHREAASRWKTAATPEERFRVFEETGVRWSELLRLPYWDPILFTVIDTMHNQYLGLLKTHCRDIWGMSVESGDGEGHTSPSHNMPKKPSEREMRDGLYCLYNGTMADLGSCSRAVLWHLCFRLGQKRSHSAKRMLKTLKTWVQYRANDGPGMLGKLMKGERVLGRDVEAKVLASSACKDALIAMCQRRQLSDSGYKIELAQRLVAWVSSLMHSFGRTECAGLRKAMCPRTRIFHRQRLDRSPFAVLGRETLAEIHADMLRTEVPSWVDPAPKNLGTKERGKLSADQWFSACTINFPFTLIRLWADSSSRKQQMLMNYMDLVTAVVVSSMLEISEDHIRLYEASINRYLSSLQTLYPEADLRPNHHLALHVPYFLRSGGPVHAQRTNFSERTNYLLQSENTSAKFGEIELTYMKTTCRASNLRALLQEPEIRGTVEEFVDAYDGLFHANKRGTKFRDSMLGMGSPRAEGVPGRRMRVVMVDDRAFRALLALLNQDAGKDVYADARDIGSNRLQLYNRVVDCASVHISGVSYKPDSRSSKDSNIIFQLSSDNRVSCAGRIRQIFQHTRRDSRNEKTTETFLVVDRFEELSTDDIRWDHYRTFPHVGGRLCYNKIKPDVLVIRPAQVLSHFAKTSVCVPRISHECVHVLPLDRV
ncbi:uncharacterized protein B0H18DRAFT_818538, partial [Fomitopsis serialis]|uniref:uncharacterized protein n=1 Tax=Fomitopsis serialis TaxID=139415 RepID=UPI002007F057